MLFVKFDIIMIWLTYKVLKCQYILTQIDLLWLHNPIKVIINLLSVTLSVKVENMYRLIINQ